jgi:hypothetical protein
MAWLENKNMCKVPEAGRLKTSFESLLFLSYKIHLA